MDAEGAVYHVGVKKGQVANRIITCGDPARLHRFAAFLDPSPKPFELVSSRGFTTVTGRYKGSTASGPITPFHAQDSVEQEFPCHLSQLGWESPWSTF